MSQPTVLIVGGTSNLADALSAKLKPSVNVLTAGRHNCDIAMDLAKEHANWEIPGSVGCVVHLAAAFGGADIQGIIETESTNVVGLAKVIEASATAGVNHFVFVSSIFTHLRDDSPFYSAYAMSKRHGEELARLCCRQLGLPLCIIRPSRIYGDTEAFRKHQPMLYSLADRAEGDEEIMIYGSHDPARNFIHVDDVAECLKRCVEQQLQGAFDCQFPRDVTIRQVAEAAVDAFESQSVVRFDNAKADIPDCIHGIETELFDEIGFQPQIDIVRGMQRIATARTAQ